MAVIDVDGFGRYGPIGANLAYGSYSITASLPNTYTPNLSFALVNTTSGASIIEGRFPNSFALQLDHTAVNNATYVKKSYSNLSRVLMGIAIMPDGSGPSGITFFDGVTAQWTVQFNTAGNIEVRRGVYSATLVATSTQAYALDAWHYVEMDVTFSNTVGACSVTVNGVATSIALTGTDTCTTANEYINTIGFMVAGIATGATGSFTDMYLFDTSGSENNALRGDTRVENLLVTSDDTTQFTFGAGVLGLAASRLNSAAAAHGSNQLILRPFTTGPACTLDSIGTIASITSGAAKLKAVLYNDNGSGSAPSGAAVAVGTEVIGVTANEAATLPFSAGQSLSAATTYWIGYITDTNITLWASDTNNSGYKASNTYASGAPSSPTMTGNQYSYCIWGNVSGVSSANYSAVGNGYSAGDFSYIQSATINHTDRYNLANLASTPASIGGIKLSSIARKTDAATRTLDLIVTSGVSTSTGTADTIPIGTSETDVATFVVTDPATSTAWAEAGVNGAKISVKVKS